MPRFHFAPRTDTQSPLTPYFDAQKALIAQRNLEIKQGDQELKAMQQLAKAKEDEYKIKLGIVQQKQVSEAWSRIGKLNPDTTEDFSQKYAQIMADLPYAHDDKGLNEAFSAMSKVHLRAVESKYNEQEATYKEFLSEKLGQSKATSGIQEEEGKLAAKQVLKLAELAHEQNKAAAVSAIKPNEDGVYNFNDVVKATTEMDFSKQKTSGVPASVQTAYAKAVADEAKAQQGLTKFKDAKTTDDLKNLNDAQALLSSSQGAKRAFETMHPELAQPAEAPAKQAPPVAPTQTPVTPTPAEPAAAASTPAPTGTPHPYEGKRVQQQSTGKFGTFVQGKFVPES